MSGVHRFLSRRDKKNPRHTSPLGKDGKRSSARPSAHKPAQFGGVFAAEDDPKTKMDKEEERKAQGVLERLRTYGVTAMVEANARYALRHTAPPGDGEAAFRLLMLLQETSEGIVRPYSPETKLLGAVNREGVTCYLDALLFAMFARLDSFEAMLYDSFADGPRRKLAGLLRLWVNLLRTGRLITTDVTRHLQDSLAASGWEDAAKLKQQDPSEAFTFITGQLELPLLTLKMDLHHAGKEDPHDDHKFVNERLLEVAIVDEPRDGRAVVTLEDCLEHYFNGRIEVKRHMENQRRNTLKSAVTPDDVTPLEPLSKIEKSSGIHVEVAELGSATNTPVAQTPATESPVTPSASKDQMERIRPGAGRKRGDSIFSQRRIELVGMLPDTKQGDSKPPIERERKLSTRTEVLMPAWQFFKLLPWYTDHMPTSDAQVAAHFSRKRPVLGICLKRYSYTNDGKAIRLGTYIDIPTEIQVPNFVSDENMEEEGPLVGNFRLLLQSVVCHRGNSVHSGHYVSLCRGVTARSMNTPESRRGSSDSEENEDPWMRFDDLAPERVSYVDVHEALRQETPYLLFYQVQPIGDDGHSIHDLPSYAEATSRSQSDVALSEKPYCNEPPGSENALELIPSVSQQSANGGIVSDTTDFARPPSARPSFEILTAIEGRRGRSSFQDDERRRSITFDNNASYAGSTSGGSVRTNPTVSVPSTPLEEKEIDEKNNPPSLLTVANRISSSRRGSRTSKSASTSKSRPPSTGPDASGSRFSLNMSKLTQRLTRSDSASAPPVRHSDEDPDVTAITTEIVADSHSFLPEPGMDGKVVPSNVEHGRRSTETARPVSQQQQPTLRIPAKSGHATLTKKDKAPLKHERRKSRKGEEDRDCVVM